MFRPLALLFALAFALPAAAQCTGANLIATLLPETRAALDAAVAAEPYPEGNLWRAEKDGHVIHVQGTVHIPDRRLDSILDGLLPVIHESDLLILEATTDQQRDLQQLMLETPEIAYITEGPTLIDLLGHEDWDRLAGELQARGIPPFLGAKMKPWLVGMSLSIPPCAMSSMVSGQLGLDARLELAAQSAGLAIETLDDVDAILGLLASGTLEEQIAMLRLTLDADLNQDDMMATTLDSYFAGRHREIWEFAVMKAGQLGMDDGLMEEFERQLLTGRNLAWAEKLPALIEGRDAVIAVGAAHLSGETGVLRTLETLGYTLTRL